jgi:hypothetical protein
MRVLLVALVLWASLAAAALAQTGYTYQPSGLEFKATAPVEAGATVKGLILIPGGMTAMGDVYVNQLFSDDLFAYWEGVYQNKRYYYDIYSGYWKPGPVSYLRAKLNFQGTYVEGWIRCFGGYYDADHFFGTDGVLYQRINITRNRTRKTNRRRQVVYSFFVNTVTKGRSDSVAPAYRYIGDDPQVIVQNQIDDQEKKLDKIIDENPAYPQWQTEAFEAPAEVVTPDAGAADSPSLLQMIEGAVGPLHEGDAIKIESHPDSTAAATDSKQ